MKINRVFTEVAVTKFPAIATLKGPVTVTGLELLRSNLIRGFVFNRKSKLLLKRLVFNICPLTRSIERILDLKLYVLTSLFFLRFSSFAV